MSLANPINVYTCQKCGGETVTIDIDEGVTPFMLACRATPNCRGMAQSSMYQPRKPHAEPAWEWFKPTEKEAKLAGPAMAEHARKGGLFIRNRGSSVQ